MKTVTYTSRATRPLPPGELAELLERARAHNQRYGLTGLLVVHNHSYIQLLEGHAVAVDALMAHIAADSRHTHLRIRQDAKTAHRRMEGWAMGLTVADPASLRLVTDALRLPQPIISMDLISSDATALAVMDHYVGLAGSALTAVG